VASTSICGHCRSGLRQLTQSRVAGFKLLARRAVSADGHANLDFKCILLWRFGNKTGDRKSQPVDFAHNIHDR
jgi:hypothetical protein